MFKPSNLKKYRKTIRPYPILRRIWNSGPMEESSLAFYGKKQSIKELKNFFLIIKIIDYEKKMQQVYSVILNNYPICQNRNHINIQIKNKITSYLDLDIKIFSNRKIKLDFEKKTELIMNNFVLGNQYNQYK